MSKSILFILSIICISFASQEKEQKIYEVVCSIDIATNKIKISDMGEGVIGFSILDSGRYAVGWENKIVVLTSKGVISKWIKCPFNIGHFDLNSKGDGFVAIKNNIYKIDNYNIAKLPIKTKFTVLGNTQGMFRIDLLPNKDVRFISLSPDFVVKGNIDSIGSLSSKKMRCIDSLLVNKITEFVGCRDNLLFFFTPKETPQRTYYQLAGFTFKDDAIGTEIKNLQIFGEDFGSFMLLSYPCRYYGGNEFFVIMKKNKSIDIVKIDLSIMLK
jgi:hypothetical protein